MVRARTGLRFDPDFDTCFREESDQPISELIGDSVELADWQETEHPRDWKGRFTDKPGADYIPDTDYRMAHQPTSYDSAAHADNVYPDLFEHPEWYMFGQVGDDTRQAEWEAFRVFQSVRGKPNKRVKVYRALPADAPRPDKEDRMGKAGGVEWVAPSAFPVGGWITPSKTYARIHKEKREAETGKPFRVDGTWVQAKEIGLPGDYLPEAGYRADDINGQTYAPMRSEGMADYLPDLPTDRAMHIMEDPSREDVLTSLRAIRNTLANQVRSLSSERRSRFAEILRLEQTFGKDHSKWPEYARKQVEARDQQVRFAESDLQQQRLTEQMYLDVAKRRGYTYGPTELQPEPGYIRVAKGAQHDEAVWREELEKTTTDIVPEIVEKKFQSVPVGSKVPPRFPRELGGGKYMAPPVVRRFAWDSKAFNDDLDSPSFQSAYVNDLDQITKDNRTTKEIRVRISMDDPGAHVGEWVPTEGFTKAFDQFGREDQSKQTVELLVPPDSPFTPVETQPDVEHINGQDFIIGRGGKIRVLGRMAGGDWVSGPDGQPTKAGGPWLAEYEPPKLPERSHEDEVRARVSGWESEVREQWVVDAMKAAEQYLGEDETKGLFIRTAVDRAEMGSNSIAFHDEVWGSYGERKIVFDEDWFMKNAQAADADHRPKMVDVLDPNSYSLPTRVLRQEKQDQWLAPTTKLNAVQSTIHHEIGHDIHRQVRKRVSYEEWRKEILIPVAKAFGVEPPREPLPEEAGVIGYNDSHNPVNAWLAQNASVIMPIVSRYSITNEWEFEAELWALFMDNPNDAPLPAKVYAEGVRRLLRRRRREAKKRERRTAGVG